MHLKWGILLINYTRKPLWLQKTQQWSFYHLLSLFIYHFPLTIFHATLIRSQNFNLTISEKFCFQYFLVSFLSSLAFRWFILPPLSFIDFYIHPIRNNILHKVAQSHPQDILSRLRTFRLVDHIHSITVLFLDNDLHSMLHALPDVLRVVFHLATYSRYLPSPYYFLLIVYQCRIVS